MKRLSSVLMGLCIVISLCGCGKGDLDLSIEEGRDSSAISEVLAEPGQSPEDKVCDAEENYEKTVIDNFYDYALGDWLSEVEIDPETMYSAYNEIYSDEVFENVKTIMAELQNNPPSEETGLGKLVVFYNQLNDSSLEGKTTERIYSMLNKVEAVNSIDKFIDLVTEPEFMIADSIFARDYYYYDSGYYVMIFNSLPYNNRFDISKEEEEFLAGEIVKQYLILGYSEEKATAKAANAIEFNKKLILFNNHSNDSMTYYSEGGYQDENHSIPLTEMMRKMGYSRLDHLNKESYPFVIYENTLRFYDEILVKDNLEEMKDFYEACLLRYLFSVGTKEMRESVWRINAGLNGYPLEELDNEVFIDNDEDFKENSLSLVVDSIDVGHIAGIYREKYYSEKISQEIEDMSKLFIDEYVEMVKELDWVSDRYREKLVIKLKTMSFLVGEYEGCSEYEDVVVGEDPLETILSFAKSNREYNKRYLSSDRGVCDNQMSLFAANGLYSSDSNTVFLPWGYVQFLIDNPDASFEEKFGFFGSLISHEIAHALSPYHVMYGVDGIYMDFITDEEYNRIFTAFQMTGAMVNGVKTENGNKYDSSRIANELFTDLLSMECSLRVLEEMDAIDYDSFFVYYAKALGYEMLPGYENTLLNNDGHVLGNERVNLIMFNFDKFYDTYEISEDNPWYIEKGRRFAGY